MTNSETILGEVFTPEITVSDPVLDNKAVQDVQPTSSYLEMLVGEGKKFADVETLAKAKLDADLHIKKLEEEAKAKIAKETNYDLILAKLEERQKPTVANQDPAVVANVKTNDLDLDRLLEDKLSKREQKFIEENNVKATWIALTENYGNPETAKAVVQELIKTKPYMKDVINKLGQTNPTAALSEILAFKAPHTVGNKSTNPLNTVQPMTGITEATITWSNAGKIRREDPKKYNSPDFQAMINKSIEHYTKQGQDYYKS